MGAKRIPVSAAKAIAKKYSQNQVILVTFDKTENRTHVVTYGTSLEECKQAAQGGNFVKKALGWPEHLYQDIPVSPQNNESSLKDATPTLKRIHKILNIK